VIPDEILEPVMSCRTLQLDCGHQIEVPLEVVPPALAAGLVQHRLSCRGMETPVAFETRPEFPLPILRGVAPR